MTPERMTVPKLVKQKGQKRIVAVTAYDHPTARLVDAADVDVILVGDSLGNVVLGYESTLPVTIEEILHHCRAVVRARPRALVIADMPFLSFQLGVNEAVRNAGRLIKEGGADGVKIERGLFAEEAAAMIRASIPVVGHVGLAPQSHLQYGGFRVQGKTQDAAAAILEEAEALERAGCFAIVLEGIPTSLAATITSRVSVPTIGIGAGPACDGQIQVFHDLFGFDPGFHPRHARRYANVSEIIGKGLAKYRDDVRSGAFPSEEESFGG